MNRFRTTVALLTLGACAAPPTTRDEPANAAIAFGVRQDVVTPLFRRPYYDDRVAFGFWRLNDDGTARLMGSVPQTIEMGCDPGEKALCGRSLVFHIRTVPPGLYALAYFVRADVGAELSPSQGFGYGLGKSVPCRGDDYRSNGAAVWKAEAGKTTYMGVFHVGHSGIHDIPEPAPQAEADLAAFRSALHLRPDAPGEVVVAPPAPDFQEYDLSACQTAQPPTTGVSDPGLRVGAPVHP
jgi:hypothetical protein